MASRVYQHTLLCEGSTDANLIPILDWLLREQGGLELVQGRRADPSHLPKKSSGMAKQITAAVEYFGGDFLFVHRDADRESLDQRHEQIRREFEATCAADLAQPVIAVVPVRMLEAWLLFDETAIRKAASNPNGTIKLDLPRLRQIESLPDPKAELKRALEQASGLRGRQLKKFSASGALWRIADYVSDFSPLRKLPAFAKLESAIATLRENNWRPGFYC